MLGGCAHLAAPKPAWHCFTRADAGGVSALSTRLLDRNGRQIEARDEWMRGFALNPRDFYQTVWERSGEDGRPVDGQVTIRLAPQGDARALRRYRLELRSTAREGFVVAAGKMGRREHMPGVALTWSRATQALDTGGPLVLAIVDPSGVVRDSQPVDPRLFRIGLDLVRRAATEATSKAAAFRQRCQPHQEIIVT